MAVAADYPASVAGRPYNSAVACLASARSCPAFWTRLAALLSFLAVMSALVAPVSMLAEEVRSGKLGGICSVNRASQGSPDGDLAEAGHATKTGAHCEPCGFLGVVLPCLAVVSIWCDPATQVAHASAPTHRPASMPGLPFSRGPPVF